MQLEERIKVFSHLGQYLESFMTISEENHIISYDSLKKAMKKSKNKNPWFTIENQMFTFKHWAEQLTAEHLRNWLSNFPEPNKPKNIGIVCAGNIPMVGFHDILTVILSGNHAKIKLSSKDDVLIPFLFEELSKIFKGFKNYYDFVERINHVDAVIATGSNNTARYFEAYFKNIPSIIRKNRTSIAVIKGNETPEELKNLTQDVLQYFGLGCRNVTQIFVPKGYDLDQIFNAFYDWRDIINHNKYANNYDYNRAIYLMSQTNIIENGFLLLKESDELNSPLATLYYKEYESLNEVDDYIKNNTNNIQCVVGKGDDTIPFGEAQKPQLNDYADGINTLEWLKNLQTN